MKTKIYSEEEKKILKSNPFVIDVLYDRFISYDPIFKLWCVLQKKFYPFKSSRELFQECGFPVSIMNKNLFRSRILDWSNLFNRYGVSYFLSDKKFAIISLEVVDHFKASLFENSNPIRNKVYNDIFYLVKKL